MSDKTSFLIQGSAEAMFYQMYKDPTPMLL